MLLERTASGAISAQDWSAKSIARMPMKESAVKALKDTGLFRQVKPLHFDVA